VRLYTIPEPDVTVEDLDKKLASSRFPQMYCLPAIFRLLGRPKVNPDGRLIHLEPRWLSASPLLGGRCVWFWLLKIDVLITVNVNDETSAIPDERKSLATQGEFLWSFVKFGVQQVAHRYVAMR
jgi:hypothetical protein